MNAIEQRIKENKRLVFKQLHRFNLAYNDDALSYAMEGLWRAAETFDDTKGYAFSTYATACIYNRIQRYFRDLNKKRIETISFNDVSIFEGAENNEYIPSRHFIQPSAEQSYMTGSPEALRKLAYEVLEKLPWSPIRQQCLELWINSDFTLTQQEIAKLVGCSQPGVSRALEAFREEYRKELNDVRFW